MSSRQKTAVGFSLLEVIIATAILAASAMVLTSLLGLGSKYGNRAEERSLLVAQTQSLLDEFIVSAGADSTIEARNQDQWELTGTLPGNPVHSYRLTAAPFEKDGQSTDRIPLALNEETPAGSQVFGLTLVRIEVFAGAEPQTDEFPMLELSQLVRTSLLGPKPAMNAAVRDPFQLLD